MVIPELKHIYSSDLVRPNIPSDIEDCAVHLQAFIGPKGDDSEESFPFTVVTPTYLRRSQLPQWGRGLLIVPAFSWEVVEQYLHRLIAHASRPTWQESAAVLNMELNWEFENYQPYEG